MHRIDLAAQAQGDALADPELHVHQFARQQPFQADPDRGRVGHRRQGDDELMREVRGRPALHAASPGAPGIEGSNDIVAILGEAGLNVLYRSAADPRAARAHDHSTTADSM